MEKKKVGGGGMHVLLAQSTILPSLSSSKDLEGQLAIRLETPLCPFLQEAPSRPGRPRRPQGARLNAAPRYEESRHEIYDTMALDASYPIKGKGIGTRASVRSIGADNKSDLASPHPLL